MKKLGSQIFFMRNRRVGHKKLKRLLAGYKILMKILFNEIALKMHIFKATHIEVTCFFNIVASGEGGVHNIFGHQIGGVTKYCQGTFRN